MAVSLLLSYLVCMMDSDVIVSHDGKSHVIMLLIRNRPLDCLPLFLVLLGQVLMTHACVSYPLLISLKDLVEFLWM